MKGFRVVRPGMMVVISSPSGGGKTTLVHMLLDRSELDFTLSVSATTRPRRPSETNGVDYHFLDMEEFKRKRDAGEFYEWAEVYGHCYASPKSEIDKLLSNGLDILFDIDYQGAEQVKKKAPLDTVTCFLLPPSMAELRRRLRQRAEDSEQVISQRLSYAQRELSSAYSYDYLLLNQTLEETYTNLCNIIHAERLKREASFLRNKKIVESLLKETLL